MQDASFLAIRTNGVHYNSPQRSKTQRKQSLIGADFEAEYSNLPHLTDLKLYTDCKHTGRRAECENLGGNNGNFEEKHLFRGKKPLYLEGE